MADVFSPTTSVGITGTPPINNQQVAGQDIQTVAPGTQLLALSDELGTPLNTTNAALNVFNTNEVTAGLAAGTTAQQMQGVGVLGIYNSTVPVISTGNYERLQLDVNGNLKVNIAEGLSPPGTDLITYSVHLTTNTTTTPTAATAYISVVAITNEVGGTTSTVTIQDKQGTPLKLVSGLATTALTTAPTTFTFNTPVIMVGGIDIITAGAVAATIDVWVNYYQ